jgi:hypothetical protein
LSFCKGFDSEKLELDRLSKKRVERDPVLIELLNGEVESFAGLNFGNIFVSLCAFFSYFLLFILVLGFILILALISIDLLSHLFLSICTTENYIGLCLVIFVFK